MSGSLVAQPRHARWPRSWLPGVASSRGSLLTGGCNHMFNLNYIRAAVHLFIFAGTGRFAVAWYPDGRLRFELGDELVGVSSMGNKEALQ